MLKKNVCIIMMIMSIFMFSFIVNAQEVSEVASGTCGENLTWVLDSEGTLTISGEGEMESYSEGGAPWYSERKNIITIVFKNDVTSIGEYTFYGCYKLTSIVIPETVTSIKSSAFENCSSLTSLNIPESVTSIKSWAFENCSSLISVTMPDGVTKVETGIFSGCSNLKSVIVPKSVTSIGLFAFKGCSKLLDVTIPEGVTSIDDLAFSGCSSLTEVVIPEGVSSIGERAFESCSGLTRMVLPESITSIGRGVFSGCSNLIDVIIPEGVINIGDSIFSGCSSLKGMIIPEGVINIGDFTFSGCSNLTEVVIPESVISIGWCAFSGCSSLTEVIIPEGVTNIGERAFVGCNSLARVTFLADLPEMKDDSFLNIISAGYYPVGNLSWSEIIESNSFGGGTFAWKAICAGEHLSNQAIKENETISTCVNTGEYEEVIYCSVCGYELSRIKQVIPINPINHVGETEVRDAKEATCGADGYTGDSYCKDCGTKIATGTEIPMKSHTYGEPVFNWLEDGKSCMITFTCTNDASHTATKDVTVTSEVKTTATCGTMGTTTYTATYNDTDKVYSAEGKTYTDTKDVADIPADETLHVESDILYTGESEKSPTCTESGIGHTECTTCKKPMQTNVSVESTGHIGGTATCKNKAECSVCHEGYGELDKNNHAGENEVKDVKEATCGADGYTGDTYCKDCGIKIANGKKIEKFTTHTWNAGVVTKEATTTEKGKKTYTCSVCKVTKVDEIPTLETPEVGTMETSDDGKATYKVTTYDVADGTVSYVAPTDAKATTVTIPDAIVIGGVTYKVTAIEKNAFKNNKNIKSVTIGRNIKTIGANVFYNCTKLKTVKFGSNVTTIGDKAFYKCTSLTKISVSSKVTKIGKNAFNGCKKLKNITMTAEKLKTIGKNAFKGINKKASFKLKGTKKAKTTLKKRLKSKKIGYVKTWKIK